MSHVCMHVCTRQIIQEQKQMFYICSHFIACFKILRHVLFPFFQVLRKSDGSLNLFQKHSFSSKISKNILCRDPDGGMQMSEDLHINQNFVYYQAYHVTNQLKISSTNLMLAHLSKSWILNAALWLIGQHQIVLEDESNLRGRQ